MNNALHTLQQQVEQWRATTTKRSRVPDAIKTAAVDLLQYYSPSTLARQLGFGQSTVHKWQRSLRLALNVQAELIEIKPSIPAIASDAADLQIMFQHGDFSAQTLMTPAQFREVFLVVGGAVCSS